jgi:Radical SAM superfamily/B12 binding domain
MGRLVYIAQFNAACDYNLLPLAAGMLGSYIARLPDLAAAYETRLLCVRESPEQVAARLEEPAVLGLSCYIWNVKYALAVAEAVKRRFPDVLIVTGGPSAPRKAHSIGPFLRQNPYVDIIAMGEGEITFAEVLRAHLTGAPWESVDGIAFRDRRSLSGCRINRPRDRVRSLDDLASPFLDGSFERLLDQYGDLFKGAIFETNRGCPFSCTFCDWGQATESRVTLYSEDRLYKELDWIAERKIPFIFCADANFGIKKRDLQLARYLARLRKETGYPKEFYVNWTKNAYAHMVDLAEVLQESGLSTVIPVAIQSNDDATLEAIKRDNIRREIYFDLKAQFNRRGVTTYTDILLPLPGETYASFCKGLIDSFSPYPTDYTSIKPVYMLVNAEIAEPEYRERHGIETRHVPAALWRHILEPGALYEDEEMIVGTAAMSVEEWRRAFNFGHILLGLRDFRVTDSIFNFLVYCVGVPLERYFEFVLSRTEGAPDCPAFGALIGYMRATQDAILASKEQVLPLPVEGATQRRWMYSEAAHLIAAQHVDALYDELYRFTREFLDQEGTRLEPGQLEELFLYQRHTFRRDEPRPDVTLSFSWDWPRIFSELRESGNAMPERSPCVITFRDHTSEAGMDRTFSRGKIFAHWREKAILNVLHSAGEAFKNVTLVERPLALATDALVASASAAQAGAAN